MGGSARLCGTTIAVLTIALLVGGCAASKSSPSKVAGPQFNFPGDLPPLPKPPAIAGMRVEIEDDGLPSQLAPRNRRPTADDPG